MNPQSTSQSQNTGLATYVPPAATADPRASIQIPREGLTEAERALDETDMLCLDIGVCPDCGFKKFHKGPRAGCSQNIQCAICGSKFNVTPGIAGSFGKERLSRGTGPAQEFEAEPRPIMRRATCP